MELPVTFALADCSPSLEDLAGTSENWISCCNSGLGCSICADSGRCFDPFFGFSGAHELQNQVFSGGTVRHRLGTALSRSGGQRSDLLVGTKKKDLEPLSVHVLLENGGSDPAWVVYTVITQWLPTHPGVRDIIRSYPCSRPRWRDTRRAFCGRSSWRRISKDVIRRTVKRGSHRIVTLDCTFWHVQFTQSWHVRLRRSIPWSISHNQTSWPGNGKIIHSHMSHVLASPMHTKHGQEKSKQCVRGMPVNLQSRVIDGKGGTFFQWVKVCSLESRHQESQWSFWRIQ